MWITAAEIADAEDLRRLRGFDEGQVELALKALEPTYLRIERGPSRGGDGGTMYVTGITDDGRRATGLWPNEEQAADALVELLTQAADHVPDEAGTAVIRRAGRLLRGVPAAVLADVTAALIRQQTGIN